MTYFISCKAQNIVTYTELKNKMGEILLSKNYIQQNEFESKKGYLVYGLHQRKISNNIKNGIYGVSTGSHRSVNFFIYDNKKVSFLDVYAFDNLLKSLDTLINYSIHKKYCRELTLDYTKRLVGVHYNINKNLRHRGDKNCEFYNMLIYSDYSVSEIKEKIVEEISHQENINQDLIEPEDIYI